jgi:hypothetical protein
MSDPNKYNPKDFITSAAALSQPGKGLDNNLRAKEFEHVRGKIDLHNDTFKPVGWWRKK